MSPLSPILALLAGVLTVFSPCILPLLPILFGSAGARHAGGPAALAVGLAASFTLVGLIFALLGAQAAFDPQVFKWAGGGALALVGLVLVTPAFGRRIAAAGGPAVEWGRACLARFDANGIGGHLVLGSLLGLVWSPCAGPTLGAASLLAAQGKDLAAVVLVMAAFGLGAAGALALIGYGARNAYARWKGRLRLGGNLGRIILGVSLLMLGALMLTGFDHIVEAALTQATPAWLAQLTSRY